MGFSETVLLGAIAGFTIYLGLPAGRLRRGDDRLRVALCMFSVGILAFIFMDVTTHAQKIGFCQMLFAPSSGIGVAPYTRPERSAIGVGLVTRLTSTVTPTQTIQLHSARYRFAAIA